MKSLYLNKKATVQGLRKLHIISAIVALLAAVAVLVLSESVTRPVTLGHLAVNELQTSGGYNIFVSAVRHIYDVRIDWLLALMLLVGAVLHARLAFRVRKQYEDSLKQRVVPNRWVSLAILGSLMAVILGLVSGVQDKSALVALVVFVLSGSALAWLHEMWAKTTKKPNRIVFWLAVIAGLMPLLIIGSHLLATVMYGQTHLPYALYAAFWAVVLGFIGLVANQRLGYGVKAGQVAAVEFNNVVLTVGMVLAVSLGVFLGVLS